MKFICGPCVWLWPGLLACTLALVPESVHSADVRARSDSNARYLHHIDLYDIDNRKITPDSTRPFSTKNTCGRCHDYSKIGHGWHFNAFDPDAESGRDGEPWIWTDARTGTQLPLSYRDWIHSYDPRDLGIDSWEMTLKFGGRIPGGGLGHAPELDNDKGKDSDEADSDEEPDQSRWGFSGSLEIDCLACHSVDGAYDINARREQIQKENFAWAPTAGLRLGKIDGDVSRIKDGSDPEAKAIQDKLPKVTYDSRNFSLEGTVFVDLIRQPSSNACYQCHSQRLVDSGGVTERWIHDEDVHLLSGMQCVDCHRNGIDHKIVRGFEGQQHPDQDSITTLSCEGCHLGHDDSHGDTSLNSLAASEQLAGRLGSPRPLHQGLPPLHFEKMSCTACHGGPAAGSEAVRMMTSLAHGLGEKGHRTGKELPAILGPVFAKQPDGKVYPHKAMWPAFWGSAQSDGSITPLPPEEIYQLTRKSLRVRKDFVDELVFPELKSSAMKEILGDDRYKTDPEEWTEAEADEVAQQRTELGQQEFNEKVSKALAAIEEEMQIEQAVYVSAGVAYAIDPDEEETLKTLQSVDAKAVDMIRWPMAHNVRPAGRSLGVQGCTECHADDGYIFASTVVSSGPVGSGMLGGEDQPITMASLQGVDPVQRLAWNQMFSGRKSFKYVIATSLIVTFSLLLFGMGMFASRTAASTSRISYAAGDADSPTQGSTSEVSQ